MSGFNTDKFFEQVAKDRAAQPAASAKPVKVLEQSDDKGWKLGNLLTLNQDDYPALGSLFAQIWEGDSVVARVYGETHDEVLSRANALLARYGKTPSAYGKVVNESTHMWKRIEEYSREVDGKKIDIYLGDFLLYCPELEDEDEENNGVVVGHYSEPYKGWYTSETLDEVFPTHFMPLPEKP